MNYSLLWFRNSSLVMDGDFLEGFQDKCSYPNTQVGCSDMHQTESSQYFKAMNVQLRINKKINN